MGLLDSFKAGIRSVAQPPRARAAGTAVAGASGAGTSIGPGPQGAVFQEIALTMQLVADAWADPADTPPTDMMRLQRDAANQVGLFAFSSSTGWVAVVLA